MFSLIITIISIALVVALVAATMYYGGSALNQGTVKADAAGFVAGAQQIAAALTIHETEGQGSPLTLLDTTGEFAYISKLIAEEYLASIPVVKSSDLNLYREPATVATTWKLSRSYVFPNRYVLHAESGQIEERTVKGIVLQSVVKSNDVCSKLNADGNKGVSGTGLYECNAKSGNVFTFFLKRVEHSGIPSGPVWN
jgi:hypothetical protein